MKNVNFRQTAQKTEEQTAQKSGLRKRRGWLQKTAVLQPAGLQKIHVFYLATWPFSPSGPPFSVIPHEHLIFSSRTHTFVQLDLL